MSAIYKQDYVRLLLASTGKPTAMQARARQILDWIASGEVSKDRGIRIWSERN